MPDCPQAKTTIYLGYYSTAEEAARRYDQGARCYFKEFACLNFPKENERQA